MSELHVIKLGGSLLDLPDLFARMEVIRRQYVEHRAVLVVGGAEAADVVRRFDAMHHLKEGDAHWLAIRAMQFNAHLIASVLRDGVIVHEAAELNTAWKGARIAVIDPLDWLLREQSQGVTIPHRWTFTSDSIAAHIAVQLQARSLTLLKSTLLREATAPNLVQLAACEGIVDADFEVASQPLTQIEMINLRHDSLAQGFVDASARQWLRCELR